MTRLARGQKRRRNRTVRPSAALGNGVEAYRLWSPRHKPYRLFVLGTHEFNGYGCVSGQRP